MKFHSNEPKKQFRNSLSLVALWIIPAILARLFFPYELVQFDVPNNSSNYLINQLAIGLGLVPLLFFVLYFGFLIGIRYRGDWEESVC